MFKEFKKNVFPTLVFGLFFAVGCILITIGSVGLHMTVIEAIVGVPVGIPLDVGGVVLGVFIVICGIVVIVIGLQLLDRIHRNL